MNRVVWVFVIGAMVSHATLRNREILSKLLHGPDEAVYQAAHEAFVKIEELSKTPPMELAHAERR